MTFFYALSFGNVIQMYYICDREYVNMDAALERKQTSFRLSADLLKRLRIAARLENRSLNSFVENTLMDAVYNIPNDETVAAIREARSGKYAGTVDTSSVEAFIKSCD